MRLPVKLLVFAASACASLKPAGAATTPLDIAQNTVESFQKNEDRKLTTITFPEKPGALPAKAEIYLIQGYISYECIRIVWSKGRASAQRVKMTRSWFYSPKENFLGEQFDIPAEDFRKSWDAAMLVRSAVMNVTAPIPRSQFSMSVSHSSHEWTYYLKIRVENGAPLVEWTVRGISTSNGIQSFADIQTRAVTKIFGDLIPKEGSGAPFDLSSWGPFLTEILVENEPATRYNPKSLDRAHELQIETSLRALGQMGYVPALDVIIALQANASQQANSPGRDQGLDWRSRVARETGYARQKIELQKQFDPVLASRLIHGFGRGTNPDRDFVIWLREAFFKQKPDDYFALLSADVQSPRSSENILRESVWDLKTKYPEKAATLFQVALRNPSSEVVADTALAVLERDPGNDDALSALTRLAEDPTASIPERTHWFDHFGRQRALDYLASARSPVPQKFRWETARIEAQLKQQWEDGRMINRLISTWSGLLNKPMPEDQQIAAYRKAIASTINMGTVDACSALIKLQDKASAGRISEILHELKANCNKELAWKPDPSAKYPWIDNYEIDRVMADLKKLDK